MPLIVNLSTIHTLYPDTKSVGKFAELCSSSGCWSYCPTLFQYGSNYAWVMYQYKTRYAELIEPYKLGLITTDQFLQNLAILFQMNGDQGDLSAEGVSSDRELYSKDPISMQLETAWNAIIGLEGDRIPRLQALIDQSEPVYLISNSNELNIFAILALLKKHNPDIKFFDPIDISVKKDETPIEIAPNIFLCLSYRYQCFKTSEQNVSQQNRPVPKPTTTSLLYRLIEQLQQKSVSRENIKVVSQYGGDLQEARNLGVSDADIHSAEDYFPSLCASQIKNK